MDTIDTPSRLRFIRKAPDLTSRFPLFDLRFEKNTARRKWKNPPLVDDVIGTLVVYYISKARAKESISKWVSV